MVKIDRIKYLLKDRHSKIIPNFKDNTLEYNYHIKLLKALKRVSGYIPFPCEFDKDGQCNGKGVSKDHMCCCGGCKDSVGYLNIVPESDIPFYAKWYTGKTGFWRKGKGCILPREYRSSTCLTFYCDDYHREGNETGNPTSLGEELIAYKKSIDDAANNFFSAMKSWERNKS